VNTNESKSAVVQSTIVVGGGLAGISAALALARRGVQVTLLESRRHLGGRAGSFVIRDSAGAEIETVDYCQHVGMGCCNNLKQLIAWLGQAEAWHEHRQLHFFGPQGTYQRLAAWPVLPAPLHLGGWLLKWPQLTFRDRMSVARGMWAIDRLPLDDQTASQPAYAWLVAQGQTSGAIQNFWSTIIVSALGEELQRVSLAAAAKVLQDGFLRQREAFHLLVPQRPLRELFGTQAEEQLKQAGVDVQLSTAATCLTKLDSQQLQIKTSTSCLTADAVVLAVPWHQLGKLHFTDDVAGLNELAATAQRLEASAITGVHTWWDRPWLDLPHAAIVGRLCQWVFPKPATLATESQLGKAEKRPSEPAAGVYYQIVISASRELRSTSQQQLAELIRADLAQVFPAVGAARLLACKAVTDPQAVFSITPQSHQHRPPQLLEPRLAVAGDWTRTGWPATMEGAILSGFAAADHLLSGNCQAGITE